MKAPLAPLALIAISSLCGCDGSDRPAERSLRRLERLAFVPAGACVLPLGKSGVDCSNPRPLVFDRYEVTRAEWLEFARSELVDDSSPIAWERWGAWREDQAQHPANWMTRTEAQRFARREGMRLATAAEWMRVAAGTRAQRLPWGQPARSVSNSLDLDLGVTTVVGTFEHGSTLRGVQDLIGNVGEWVDGYLLEDRPPEDQRGWAMGGSYLSWERDLYAPSVEFPNTIEYNADLLGPDARSQVVGLRLCADAETYLLAQAPGWPTGNATRERLRAVGARWGRVAVPLLEELAARPEAPAPLLELLEGARQ